MARFMDGARPDPAAFHDNVASVLHAARATGATEVRAWGEMVNLLWKQGNLPAAMRLEELWNEAIDKHGIRLLCSYETHGLDVGTFDLLSSLTHGHGRLIPVEDTDRLDHAVAQAVLDVCGEDAPALMRAIAKGTSPLAMPRSASMLVALRRMLPYFGDRIIARARDHYDGARRAPPPAMVPGDTVA
ncbi:MAG: MEDS domain-containing protein [Halobacteriales archaeon]|nr:MEDS domain-containing protein [Halobacteriales archaeon]